MTDEVFNEAQAKEHAGWLAEGKGRNADKNLALAYLALRRAAEKNASEKALLASRLAGRKPVVLDPEDIGVPHWREDDRRSGKERRANTNGIHFYGPRDGKRKGKDRRQVQLPRMTQGLGKCGKPCEIDTLGNRGCDYPACMPKQPEQEGPVDFDSWLANPYTKVLQESIKNDYVPRYPSPSADAQPNAEGHRPAGSGAAQS